MSDARGSGEQIAPLSVRRCSGPPWSPVVISNVSPEGRADKPCKLRALDCTWKICRRVGLLPGLPVFPSFFSRPSQPPERAHAACCFFGRVARLLLAMGFPHGGFTSLARKRPGSTVRTLDAAIFSLSTARVPISTHEPRRPIVPGSAAENRRQVVPRSFSAVCSAGGDRKTLRPTGVCSGATEPPLTLPLSTVRPSPQPKPPLEREA